MNAKVTELREKLAKERAQWKARYDEFPDGNIPAETVKELRERNEAMTKLAEELESAETLAKAAEHNQREHERLNTPLPGMKHPGSGGETKTRSLREILESKGRGLTVGDSFELSGMEAKTLSTSADLPPQADRRPGIVDLAQETRPTVLDLFLQGTTTAQALEYFEETTFTNNAAAVAEGGTKPESALDFTLRSDSVRKVATWIPVTKEMLDDVPTFESYLRGRLGFMVERAEEAQVLSGDGVAPNILGILNRTGVQTQAKGADPVPDAIYKAMTKVRNTGFAEPTALVMHPNDWQDVRLLRTADGVYIWGSPADAGPDRIWGMNVRVTTGMTENTALVGAFRPYGQVFRREGLRIDISNSHSTFFVENKLAVLAETRLALAIYRPSAFATITGI